MCLFFVASRLQVTISFTMKNKVVSCITLTSGDSALDGRLSGGLSGLFLGEPSASDGERAFSLQKSYSCSVQVTHPLSQPCFSPFAVNGGCVSISRLWRQGNL